MQYVNEIMNLKRGVLQVPGFNEDRYAILFCAIPYKYLWLVPNSDYLVGSVTDKHLIRQKGMIFKVGEVLALAEQGSTRVKIPQHIIPHLRLDLDSLVRVMMDRPDQLEIWKKSDCEAMERAESLEDVFASMSARGL